VGDVARPVTISILVAFGGGLVALYALTGNAWSPSYIVQRGHAPSGQDFALHGAVGYFVYSDRAATFTFGSAATQRRMARTWCRRSMRCGNRDAPRSGAAR
jgi:hypothetical protein